MKKDVKWKANKLVTCPAMQPAAFTSGQSTNTNILNVARPSLKVMTIFTFIFLFCHCISFPIADSTKFRIVIPIGRARDSSVGIATRYGLDGPGIESRWGARLSAPVQTGPGPHPASYIMSTGFYLGVKRPERGVDHPHPSSAEIEGKVEQYLYSPSGPSLPVLG